MRSSIIGQALRGPQRPENTRDTKEKTTDIQKATEKQASGKARKPVQNGKNPFQTTL
jgi:hypothetical protein